MKLHLLPALALPALAAFAPAGGVERVHAVSPVIDAVTAQEIKNNQAIDLFVPNPGLAVGPNHAVQTTNLTIRGFDKSNGSLVLFDGARDIYGGLGAPLSTEADANQLVAYDSLANRFLFVRMPRKGGQVGFAVTQGADPAGPYHLYSHDINVPLASDNPRVGVWPDGYYLSYDVYDPSGTTYYGYHLAVFERAKMLSGDPTASWQQTAFPTTGFPPVHENLVPTTMGGWGPPAGTPFTFAQKFDAQTQGNGTGSDGVYLWSYDVDWANPWNTSITQSAFVPTSGFDSVLGDLP